MGKIIKFELLKIIRRKSSMVMVFFSMVIMLYLFGGIAFQESTYDENGTSYRGLKAIAKEKEAFQEISYKMTEEQITKDIVEYQNEFNNPDNVTYMDGGNTVFFKDEVYWRFLCPKKDYYTMISENYDNPFEYGGFSKLPQISTEKGAEFYKFRLQKINKMLNQEYQDANYTQAEKNFWLNMNEKVEQPFVYGYAEGWMNLIKSTGLWFFMILAICVCLAPVFASEYQSGMDALIFTSKYGKSKVIGAKIIASYIFGSAVFVIDVIISITTVLIPFGIEGWNLQVQIMDTVIPYPLNFLEAVLLYIVIAYLIVLAFISFNLLLSVSMKTPYPVIIIDAVLLIIPLFMSYSETNYIYNHVYPLFPTKALEMSLSYFTDYRLGGLVISWPMMIVVLYIILAAVMLPFVWRRFIKHQIM